MVTRNHADDLGAQRKIGILLLAGATVRLVLLENELGDVATAFEGSGVFYDNVTTKTLAQLREIGVASQAWSQSRPRLINDRKSLNVAA